MEPVTASRAPSTRRTSESAMTGRSNALLGTHAQYEHSPPTSSRSTRATRSPAARARSAAFWPIGPAPSTTTSKSPPPAAVMVDDPFAWVGRHVSALADSLYQLLSEPTQVTGDDVRLRQAVHR